MFGKIVVSLYTTVACSILMMVNADFDTIVSYQPQNDVSEHLKIDLDLQAMDTGLQAGNYTEAYKWYNIGGNSIKTSGAIRTVRGFSTTTSTLSGEKWYEIYANYWGIPAYADNFTSSACLGTGDFTASTSPVISSTARKEGCLKGAQYQNVWMYVVHELEAAIEDCEARVIGAHWDEAVAFYTGSTVVDGTSSSGYSLYGVAEKRCLDFGTCTIEDDDSGYTAQVNGKVFELFEKGQDYQYAYRCTDMEATKEALVVQFAIPLIQGVLKYAYLADVQGSEKQRAELFAFAASLLPYLNYYDATASTQVSANTLLTSNTPVASGYPEVKYYLESAYTAMGVTCEDIGGYKSSAYTTGYFPGMEPCDSSSSSSSSNNDNFPTYAIVLVVLLPILLVAIAALVLYYFYYSNKSLHARLVEHENAFVATKSGYNSDTRSGVEGSMVVDNVEMNNDHRV